MGADDLARAAGSDRDDRRRCNLSPLAFLFAVNVFLLVFGIFIEPLPGIVVLVPILAPIAHALGISDLQFGIIVIVNLTMGMLTPPVGGLLFVTSVVARVPLAKLIGELWPFLWAQIGVLALLSLVSRDQHGAAGAVRVFVVPDRSRNEFVPPWAATQR